MPDNRKRLDPWTFGELHPSGMSHVTQPRAQPAGLAHPPRPARATRQASLPTRPCWGAPAGCRQMWGWLSRCLPSPLTAWLAGINGGLPRRPPPTLASSLTATTTTLPRWAGLCGPRSRRCHTRPPARPDTPRSPLVGAAGGYRPHRVNHTHKQHAHTAATYALRRDQRAAGQRAAAEAAVETPAAIHTEPFTLALARMAAALPPGTCDGGASAAATHSILLRKPPPWAAQGLSCMLLARCCATSCTSW